MKPGSYTQLYVQYVFAVKYREALLHKDIQARIYEYIGGIISTMKHKSIIVNGHLNHIHILVGQNPNISISDTVLDMSRNDKSFVGKVYFCPGAFGEPHND